MANTIARVPIIMQMEALECGAASLAMVLAYYKKWVPLEQVRLDCGVSRDGSNAANLLKAARAYGLEAKGYRFEPAALREHGQFPCILHWNFNHFVVLCGFKGDRAVLADPARGSVTVTMEEFDQAFTGICLMMKPGPAFEPGGKPHSVLGFARERLRGSAPAFAIVIITTLLVTATGIMTSVFSRVFTDRILTGDNPDWLYPLLALMAGVVVVQAAVSIVRAVCMERIEGKFAIVGNATFMWHVLRLPMEFFSQRMAGDIASRQATNATIASTLISAVAPAALNLIMLVFYLVVMLRYSVVLTVVGLATTVINAAVARIVSNKRTNITRVQMRDEGKLASTTVAGIEMIESIKSSGAENGFFARWAGYQASVNSSEVHVHRVNQLLGEIPTLVQGIANAVVLVMGCALIMSGEFTPGALMAFQGFLASFLAPCQSLIATAQSLQEMRTNMERIEDVMDYPVAVDPEPGERSVHDARVPGGAPKAPVTSGDARDLAQDGSGPASAAASDAEGLSFDKLSGRLAMEHVTFGYSRLAAPLIEDFSLDLKAGGSVAFVGPSGCGKSTLAKLISGLYEPWEGAILFDGKPREAYMREVLTGSLAVVDQDIVLFEDTIANNIKMWDSSIEDFEMIMAARDAHIHDAIMERDGGYGYKILEGGRDFSGGQRQRLEIARVLAQDPTLIIMDEATSALDAKTEYEVMRSVRDRGITTIVVAHRLSTIRDCDEIIVLDRGHVVERGTHEELYRAGGLYTTLVTSE